MMSEFMFHFLIMGKNILPIVRPNSQPIQHLSLCVAYIVYMKIKIYMS